MINLFLLRSKLHSNLTLLFQKHLSYDLHNAWYIIMLWRLQVVDSKFFVFFLFLFQNFLSLLRFKFWFCFFCFFWVLRVSCLSLSFQIQIFFMSFLCPFVLKFFKSFFLNLSLFYLSMFLVFIYIYIFLFLFQSHFFSFFLFSPSSFCTFSFWIVISLLFF